MTKYILCDIPNTLLDSRHRQTPLGVSITGIKEDELNYPCMTILKCLIENGYTPVFTHYCLTRLTYMIKAELEKYKLPIEHLYTNSSVQEVHDNVSLKKHTADKFDFDYVIDNDEHMKSFWLNRQVGLIQVPLGIL